MNKKETQKINIFEHLFLYQERKQYGKSSIII